MRIAVLRGTKMFRVCGLHLGQTIKSRLLETASRRRFANYVDRSAQILESPLKRRIDGRVAHEDQFVIPQFAQHRERQTECTGCSLDNDAALVEQTCIAGAIENETRGQKLHQEKRCTV
jgi:hypothetical protein